MNAYIERLLIAATDQQLRCGQIKAAGCCAFSRAPHSGGGGSVYGELFFCSIALIVCCCWWWCDASVGDRCHCVLEGEVDRWAWLLLLLLLALLLHGC